MLTYILSPFTSTAEAPPKKQKSAVKGAGRGAGALRPGQKHLLKREKMQASMGSGRVVGWVVQK